MTYTLKDWGASIQVDRRITKWYQIELMMKEADALARLSLRRQVVKFLQEEASRRRA